MVVQRAAIGVLAIAFGLLTGCNSDPRQASRRYVERGNRYFASGKYKEASLLYRRALRKDAKCAAAWYQLGLTNDRLALPAEARKDFARAMNLDPGNTAAIVRLGDLDLLFYAADQHGHQELLSDLKDLSERLLRRNNKSYDGWRFSGEIALIEKDLARAIQSFERANAARPFQAEMVLALAQSLETSGDDARAVSVAREMLEHDQSAGSIYDFLYTNCLRRRQLEPAEQILLRKVADNPARGEYRIQLAFHYYMTKRVPEMSATLERLTEKPNEFAGARVQVGDFYARIGDYDRALEQYGKGQQENPKARRTYRKKMVEVLATEGKHEQAAKLVEDLSREAPADVELIGLHGMLLLASRRPGDLKKAIGEMEPLSRKPPANAVLHYNLGRAYLADGAQEQARAQFAEVLRMEPNHIAARLGLAQAEFARGDSGLAVNETSRVLSSDPHNADARLLRARALANIGEYGKAREDLEVRLGMDPKSADTRLQLADLDMRERHFEIAEAEFRALMSEGDLRGMRGAIETLARQGKWEQAIQIAGAEKSPAAADRAVLASLLLRSGKYAEAVGQFQTLIDRDPKAEPYYLQLGDAKSQLNDVAGARAAFEKARELAPADALPEVALGILSDRAGNLSEARKAYEAALRKQPDHATALNNLAYLEAEQGVDLDQALIFAQRALGKRPRDAQVIDTLGLIYLKKNLTEDGFKMLSQAVQMQPANATFRVHLALAWYQKGDRSMARKELETARRSKPSLAERSAIQELSARVG